jgi:hypothetical protein
MIPSNIYLTYKDREKVPKNIWQSYEKLAGNFKVDFFSDIDCYHYLESFSDRFREFGSNLHELFESLPSGPHKADLWRYAILYEKGGLYLDIKTVLVKPFDEIFNLSGDYWYTVLSGYQPREPEFNIHQGVIATPPRNPIILRSLEKFLETPVAVFEDYYWTSCHQVLEICEEVYEGSLADSRGKNKEGKIYTSKSSDMPHLCLFEEHCKDGQDKYGWDCWIEDDTDSVIFRTRDKDYGRTW